MKEIPDHFHLVLGCIIVAVIFTIVYSKWARGHHSLSQGIQFGLLIGIFAGFGGGLIDFSTSNMLQFSGFLINATVFIVYYVVMGVLASLFMGKFSSSKE